MASFYPKKISERLLDATREFHPRAGDAIGSSAAIECGSHVRFAVDLRTEGGPAVNATFQTNGCGFMRAAADVMLEAVRGKLMTELHSLDQEELAAFVEEKLNRFPADREHCLTVCIGALRSAFVDLRQKRIEEFTGEKTLVCTCFSVTEEAIENIIVNERLTTVRSIGERCNAGTGCGSCLPVIQDMLDAIGGEA